MFTNFKLAFSIAKYAVNIKMVLESVYNVINKLVPVLGVIDTQTQDSKETKLGKIIQQFLPVVQTAVNKIKQVIEKYGPLVGFETTVYSQANEDAHQALLDALKELDAVVDSKK